MWKLPEGSSSSTAVIRYFYRINFDQYYLIFVYLERLNQTKVQGSIVELFLLKFIALQERSKFAIYRRLILATSLENNAFDVAGSEIKFC